MFCLLLSSHCRPGSTSQEFDRLDLELSTLLAFLKANYSELYPDDNLSVCHSLQSTFGPLEGQIKVR